MEKEPEQKAVKILHVFGRLDMGGAENMVINLFRHIDKNVVWFDFVEHTQEHCYFDDEILDSGSKIFRCPEFNARNFFAYRKWWKDFLLSHPEYRIIHSHVRSTASIYFPIAKRMGRKTIIHSHSTSNGRGFKAAVKKILQLPLRFQADYFMSCSKIAGEWLFGKRVCQSNKYLWMPNAIDLEKYKLNPEIGEKYRKELGIENKRVYIHIGSFGEAKNHDFLIEVFKMVHDRMKNTVLLLIGDGKLKEDIERKTISLGIGDCVIFLGIRNDIAELLQASEVLLFPSRWEGLPVTVMEAQAAGLPCLISDRITRDVDVTDLVHRLSLENREVWVDAALSDLKRKDVTSQLQQIGFDIKRSAKMITKLYSEMNGETNN